MSLTPQQSPVQARALPSATEPSLEAALPLVKQIATRIAGRCPANITTDDLYGAGVLGLLEAMDRFDPGRGVPFEAFARRRVTGAILDLLRRYDHTPRGRNQERKELDETCRALEQRLGRPATETEVAEALGLSLPAFHEKLRKLRDVTLVSTMRAVSLETGETDQGTGHLIADAQENPYEVCERREVVRILAGAIDQLPERERLVVSLYYYDGLTMKEVGQVLGVTESRICQLHTQAMGRLRNGLADRWPTEE